ncbi:MAG: hypothetical protein D6753_11505 [Planctomycetota bacterium]|nr:MAG: hypothetical protein D6753_11505 [Planctomycetota bacterium]
MANPLRVLLLTNATSQHSLPVLEAVAHDARIELVGVLLHDSVTAARSQLLTTIRRHGWGHVYAKMKSVLGSKLAARRTRNTPAVQSAYAFAVTNGLDYHLTTRLSDAAAQAWMRDRLPDLLLSCSFSQILPSPLIHATQYGAINIHPSLLPRYRGPEPAFWMLFHGETHAGVTFHLIDTRIDHGPLIAQFPLEIAQTWTPEILTAEAFRLAARHTVQVLQEWAAGDRMPIAQDHASSSYYGFPTWRQRREFRRRWRRRQLEAQ